MLIPAILLQVLSASTKVAIPENISIFTLLVKGGWVMIPLALLSILLLYYASDSWFALRKIRIGDRVWFSGAMELVKKGHYDEALEKAKRVDTPLSKIVCAGIEGRDLPQQQMEEDMQSESRQAIARMEAPVSYLGMIASMAPMLGFLGTIFGVITIFMNISATNELSISSISDGLYQKMICSGVGLLEGIIAYCLFWLLSKRIDSMVLSMDKGANIFIKALKSEHAK